MNKLRTNNHMVAFIIGYTRNISTLSQ